ncbi:MAG: tRNA (adenosine(37)-N6)-dimethylallyltransferase MiaA [Defluviitaleaceae bacterium]|nr:tRNA (adenosine(37)-N6)-dimethylallyltransferase MiaA [Defluviitaleaceae bacterium]
MMDLKKIKKLKEQKNLIVIAGATATGKTAVAVELAQKLNGEIISADSMQVYKGMNIGTAKPTIAERGGIIHHLIDVVDVVDIADPTKSSEKFSVAMFQKLANQAIIDIYNRGKIPILAGGTGFYINAVIYDNTLVPEKYSRKTYNAPPQALYKQLLAVDPISAAKIHPNNVQRVSAALAYYETTGKPISSYTPAKTPRYNNIIITLHRDRQELYAAINRRTEQMFANGFLQEVQDLLDNGITNNTTAMQAIGYKEVISYLNGEFSFSETLANIQQNSRRYAKRQLTWLRHQLTDSHCLNATETPKKTANACLKILKNSWVGQQTWRN